MDVHFPITLVLHALLPARAGRDPPRPEESLQNPIVFECRFAEAYSARTMATLQLTYLDPGEAQGHCTPGPKETRPDILQSDAGCISKIACVQYP